MTTTSAHDARSSGAAGWGQPTSAVSASARRAAAVILSVVVLLVMVTAAITGLVLDGAYGGSVPVAAMLRGYDVTALVAAAPLLVWALVGLRRGSGAAELVWVGMLAYSVYTYAFYLFAAGFTDLFLLHVAAFAGSVYALPLALSTLHPVTLLPAAGHRRLASALPRLVSGVLALLAATLGVMWMYVSVREAVTGQVPGGSALIEPSTVVHTGIALDLALLVPAYSLAAALLWRRARWGFAVAAVALVSGMVHQVSYLAALVFQANAGVPGAQALDWGELPIALVYLLATAGLFVAWHGSAGLSRKP